MTDEEITAAAQRTARRRNAIVNARRQVEEMPNERRLALVREFELTEEQARIVVRLAR